MSYDPTTRAYATRRRTEGRSNREIRRCLKALRLPIRIPEAVVAGPVPERGSLVFVTNS